LRKQVYFIDFLGLGIPVQLPNADSFPAGGKVRGVYNVGDPVGDSVQRDGIAGLAIRRSSSGEWPHFQLRVLAHGDEQVADHGNAWWGQLFTKKNR
jgi:hypothetical protein